MEKYVNPLLEVVLLDSDLVVASSKCPPEESTCPPQGCYPYNLCDDTPIC